MNKHIIKFSIAFLLIFTVSCESYLDVNKDPDVLGDVDSPKRILPIAEVGLANQLMGYDLGFGGAYWAQYWTQSYTASQFKVLCEFQEVQFASAYGELTAGVLNDLKRIKTISTADEDKGYAFIAETLSIIAWQYVTDIWGDIPYFEALRGDEGIYNPNFDTGEAIYADLLTRVDVLLATDVSEYSIDNGSDFIYNGDFAAWKKLAAAAKLKLLMRQSETSNYNNANVITFINNNDILTSAAKIPGSTWNDAEEGKRHPMREFQEAGANYLSTNVIGCKSFVDYLKNNNDPRLDAYFTAPSGGHLGAFFGDFNSKEDSDLNGTDDEDEEYSEAKFNADQDLMVVSDWEINFFIAEAHARANDLANAKMYYDKAVTASLNQNGIAATDIITTGYATWVNYPTVEENLKQIQMQKWVANANYQFIEAFLERNRLKYPSVNEIDIKADRNFAYLNFPVGDITISVVGKAKTNGFLPATPVYPQSILDRNTNAPGQKTNILEPVWWDQKAAK